MFWQFTVFFLSVQVFFDEHSRFTGQLGKGEAISLLPFFHFHLLHRHLDIIWSVTAESSPSAHSQQSDSNQEPLISERQLLTNQLSTLQFTVFQYRFDSPQVKPDLISSLKDFVNKLPHKLANNLKLRILGKWKILGKITQKQISKFFGLVYFCLNCILFCRIFCSFKLATVFKRRHLMFD